MMLDVRCSSSVFRPLPRPQSSPRNAGYSQTVLTGGGQSADFTYNEVGIASTNWGTTGARVVFVAQCTLPRLC